MAWSKSVLKDAKIAVDALGTLNQAARYVLDLIDPQQKNLFEMILYPEIPPDLNGWSALGTLAQVAAGVLDTAISKFYVQTLDIPVNSLEYERFDRLQAVKDFNYADDITISFLENDLGIVRTFLINWMGLQFKQDPNPLHGGGYVLVDNQYTCRKKALIFPMMRTGIPSTTWIEVRGMRFKSMENLQYNQNEAEPQMITVTFACDEIYLNSLLNAVTGGI